MVKDILYISVVCGMVMMQASEKKKTKIDTVDQLRNEMRSEREKNGGSTYLDHLMNKRGRFNHDTDKKTVDHQKKETV